MKFNAHQGCFQLTFENGVTLSVSTRYAFGWGDDSKGQEYAEVRAWDAQEREIELSDSRINVSEYLALCEKLSHPDILKRQDCE